MAVTLITPLKMMTTLCTIVTVAGQAQQYNNYQPSAAGYNNYQPAAGYNGYNQYQPPADLYTNYQIPPSPALNSYGSQPQYDRKCNDLNCKRDECCIETHRGSQCIGLTMNTATNQWECARPKKCYSSSGCATGFCCVWAIDTTVTQTCPNSPASFNGYGNAAPSYGYGYGNAAPSYGYGYANAAPSYGYGYGNAAPSYGYGYGNAAQNEGWCFKAVGTDKPCWVPLPGQAQKGCPCQNPLEVCVPIIDPFTVGTCRVPIDVTS